MSEITSEQLSATEMKINTAKQKKDTADQAFKAGQWKDALKSYHEALMYVVGIDRNALKGMGMTPPPPPVGEAPPEKEKTEVDEIVEKIYANMSACHLKQENWKRAIETADKALSKNESNYKAMFRKGKAQGELGFYEKAVKTLQELKKKNPSDTAIVDAELARLKSIDDEREKVHKQKYKGFLKKAVAAEIPIKSGITELPAEEAAPPDQPEASTSGTSGA